MAAIYNVSNGGYYITLSVELYSDGMIISKGAKTATGNSQELRKILVETFSRYGYQLTGRTYNLLDKLYSHYGDEVYFDIAMYDIFIGDISVPEVKMGCCIAYYELKSGNETEYFTIERMGDTKLKIDRVAENDLRKLSRYNDTYSKAIRDWCRKYYEYYKVQDVHKSDMTSMGKFAKAVYEHYPKGCTLDIRGIMEDAKARKINIHSGKKIVPHLNGVESIKRFNTYEEFLSVNIQMDAHMNSNEIKAWFNSNKGKLYEVLKWKYESEKFPNRKLSNYVLHSSNVGADNLLSLTFILKPEILKIEKEKQEEKRRRQEQREERAADRAARAASQKTKTSSRRTKVSSK